MKYLIIIIFLLSGCQTVATQSEDGLKLTIKGKGKAKFSNSAEIEGGSYIPELPRIRIDQ